MKADWAQGVWTAETNGEIVRAERNKGQKAGAKNGVRLTIGSDWLPLRGYEIKSGEDPLAVYGDLLPLLRNSDVNIINVETTLGSHGLPIPKAGPNFRADENAVRALTAVPFHVACMANNHIMDYGADSLRRTLDVLREAGLQTVGAGLTGEEAARPLFLEIGDIAVAIINCGEGEACCSIDNGPGANGFELSGLTRQIRHVKSQADHVLVLFHGGREYAPMPPEYVVNGLREAAEAGASAVIAHHPHVPQGIEIYGGVPIVYSQGNFVFWQEDDAFYKHTGYLVHLDVRKDRISGMEISPYVIERNGLSLMNGQLKAGFLQAMRTVSELLADPHAVRAVWNAFVDVVGLSGMTRNLETVLAELAGNTGTGAARLHNLFFAPAHRELFMNGLKRASHGELGDSPEWAKMLVRHWQKCRCDEGKRLCTESGINGGYLENLLQQAHRHGVS
ncbi:CapA family protein [Paenibacillus hemerocallicola]|uniref:CapA family protein n=1 Tax=Paenibacillus hemerocallicola TaxID=1172614 RepID=A0A5C4SX42_9BACL|nr:CapA family protein [Paenibacillus hemerocallicola]TNJ58672.1 CapA family protein [Paenibacillus hemerocallicola]